MICQECHAMVRDEEYHPYEFCLIAKAYPTGWRKLIAIIQEGEKIERLHYLKEDGGVK